MNWTVENVPELRGYTVEWAETDNFYLSRRNRLFHSSSLKPPFEEIAVIEAPFWKQVASSFRLAQRLLRFMVTNVIPTENGELFVTFDKTVGIIRNGKYIELKGLIRPCRVLRSAYAVDESGNIFFGEYLANEERGLMRVYKYSKGSEALEVVYTFPPGSIRHIHGLYFDKFTKSVFCLTGDKEKECQILRSSDGFKTTEIVGQGDETWRAVSILFDRKYFYYGTDAEFRANHIYKVNRESLERKNLGEVSGTIFYSKQLGENLFFTSTAENAPSQKEKVAALWYIDAEDNTCEIIKFKKDLWHGTLFMWGTIHFPCVNNLENELYFHVVGVNEDNQTFRIRPQTKHSAL
ncbi:MAG TPA: hypothetical protein VGC76_08835 [Pyrinomonadaceae bacterium]|jgi:hypothetical protein